MRCLVLGVLVAIDLPPFGEEAGLLRGQIGASKAEPYRHAFIIAGNHSFEDWAEAADEHLPYPKIPAIDLSAHDAFGIFDSVPGKYASASAFASSLIASAAANHGHALPRMVDYILSQDPEELETTIASRRMQFKRNAKIDEDNGTAVRTVELFGLIYAAGHLGQEAGALPRNWKIGPSVMRCYRVYQRAKAPPRPFLDRLSDLIEHEHIMDLPLGAMAGKKSGHSRADAAFGFSKRQGKDVELWLYARRMFKLCCPIGRLKSAVERCGTGWSLKRAT
tara:strand:+ start:520 stop:1353 length:834 start_codon:yes stop_codon:yes gene_type:complete